MVARDLAPVRRANWWRQRTSPSSSAAYSATMSLAVESELDALAGLLGSARNVLVLTGAGMSTDSGVPDYRGPDGARRVTPVQYHEFVRSADMRRRYWARAFVGWRRFATVEANAGHRAIARLQTVGALGAVITQNVDGLHQAAGSRDVVELHGTLARVVCLACGARSRRGSLNARTRELNPHFAPADRDLRPDGDIELAESDVARFVVPPCRCCGSDLLKPDVVFFGESVPKSRVTACGRLTDAAHALLVLGTSLRVYSGYRFVRRAAERGIPVAIVTRGPSRGDPIATVRLDAALGQVLPALADRLAD
jgi:NAD-dependent SIR2 family protein deacetylase